MSSVLYTMDKLPSDILLAFATLLDVEDLLSLLATCHWIRALSEEPALWINCIRRIEGVQMHPVVLSTGDVAALPRAQLKAMAHRAARILRNLASSSPRLERIQSIGSPLLEGHFKFFIPGTRLLLTNAPGRVECWDVIHARLVASTTLDRLRILGTNCVSSGSDVLFSAVVLESGPLAGHHNGIVIESLAVIRIDLSDLKNINITTVVSPRIIHEARHTPHTADIFLTEKLMGIACRGPAFTVEAVSLLCWPMDSSQPVSSIQYPFSQASGPTVRMVGLSFDAGSGILYGLSPVSVINNDQSVVYSIPIRPVDGSIDPAAPMTTTTISHSYDDGPREYQSGSSSGSATTFSSHAKFGVRAVARFCRHFIQLGVPGAEHRRRRNYLVFLTGTAHGPTSDSLLFETLGDYHVAGYSGRYLVFSSPSAGGAHALGMARLLERESELQTMHFLGGSVDARDVSIQAVDDILGLVAVWDGKRKCVDVYSYSGDWGCGTTGNPTWIKSDS
ncbi:hypothetical protein MIND_00180800 [Mycena indigotica]|uniref:F-box domain-containing protein n=1 Tax=Mycena indigotica TaxID=2126181 RepID=A0A8H6WGQ3_9AGAR|nr:uncharacterized protein MIND_00180800 [Mycena indigotica]KAF7311709.1 hypothetical protein MIND_00180800 [Mycena indigotica]